MAIGVACTVDSRFSAVTTISSSPALFSAGVLLPAGAASAGPLKAAAHSSAAAADPDRVYVVNDSDFMSESP